MDFKMGWKRDLPDRRDQRFKLANVLEEQLPKVASLRSKMPPVNNQGKLGCCTAEAICGMLHYRELTDDNTRLVKPSVLFQYYNTRVLEGTVKEDAGASIRSAVKAAAKYGMCADINWPFEPSKYKVKPNKRCYDQARPWKAVSYARIDTGPQLGYLLKYNLTRGNPIAFGAALYAGIENDLVTRSGFIPYPKEDERSLGGHAMLIVGYDDDRSLFEVRNSWGNQWGDNGYGMLPQKYVLDSDLAADFWTVFAVP